MLSQGLVDHHSVGRELQQFPDLMESLPADAEQVRPLVRGSPVEQPLLRSTFEAADGAAPVFTFHYPTSPRLPARRRQCQIANSRYQMSKRSGRFDICNLTFDI
jgi:hypothetical protein